MALSRYGGITGTKKISEDFENINVAFNNVAAENDGIKSDINRNKQGLEDHKNSTSAHPAQNIPYSGAVTGANNTKEALDKLKQEINDLILGGDDSDPNTRAEVEVARGGRATLGDRLDATDAKLANMANKNNLPVNAKDFGALGDGVQISTTYIQAAIDSAPKVTVYIPAGHYLLNKSLKLHSDTTLIVADDATIELVAGCDSYFLENSDMVNGNTNITVKGGRWIGNGATMTRTYGTTLANSYYGFGFLFYKVSHLKVTDLRIDETVAWAIAHMSCNYCEFRNIFVWQIEGQGLNGDGITGQSSNVVIDNIRGYTNDDMIAPLAYGAQMGANELHFEKIDTENISISNIFPMTRGTTQTWRAVAAYARAGKTIKNLNISNVFGESYQSLVKISGHASADGFFRNVNISNITGRARTQGVIEVTSTTVYTLNISDMCRTEDSWSIGQINVGGGGIVHQMNVSNVNIRWENGANGRVVYCQGTIYNLNLNNIVSIDVANTTQKVLFQNTGVVTAVNTKIKAANIQVTEIGTTDIILLQNGARCSLDCADFDELKTKFTPRKGDRIRDRTDGPIYFNGTAWQAII
ncbi:glycosyl hydrolase family 28-related protein [Paenibacillus humicus]|uniref:glycosyl hydrolase family 28-related protein n=1 Tax=Paenibacillus humicus TaxID=412861 RepID=UPI003D268500